MGWYFAAVLYVLAALLASQNRSAAGLTGAIAVLTAALLPALIFVVLGKLSKIQEMIKESHSMLEKLHKGYFNNIHYVDGINSNINRINSKLEELEKTENPKKTENQ